MVANICSSEPSDKTITASPIAPQDLETSDTSLTSGALQDDPFDAPASVPKFNASTSPIRGERFHHIPLLGGVLIPFFLVAEPEARVPDISMITSQTSPRVPKASNIQPPIEESCSKHQPEDPTSKETADSTCTDPSRPPSDALEADPEDATGSPPAKLGAETSCENGEIPLPLNVPDCLGSKREPNSEGSPPDVVCRESRSDENLDTVVGNGELYPTILNAHVNMEGAFAKDKCAETGPPSGGGIVPLGCDKPENKAEPQSISDFPNTSSPDANTHEPSEFENPFEIDGLPKLEEFIPEKYFPDRLFVHDPDGVTSGRDENSSPMKYKRIFPGTTSVAFDTSNDDDPLCRHRIAHLYLTRASRLGVGHHSSVYRSSLRLPRPLAARSPNNLVTVAAKVSLARRSARELLVNEAETYNAFPKHLMEEWCGYNLVPGLRYPVSVGAVVPKFFGYYIPDFVGYDDNDPCHPAQASPILLLEECGEPVAPWDFSIDEK